MFISNLWVVLLIRVVNLVIGRLSTTNDDFYDLRVWQGCHPVVSLQMWTGWHPIRFTFFSKCKPDGVSSGCHFVLQMTIGWNSHPVYNLKKMWIGWSDIRLSFCSTNDNRMILKVILVILIWILWELIFFMEL